MGAAAVLLEVDPRAMRRTSKHPCGIAVGLTKLDELVARFVPVGERRAWTQRRPAIGDGGQHLIVDINQSGRVLGDGARPRDDDGDRFPDKYDLVLGQDERRDIGWQLIGAKLQRQPLRGQQRRQIGISEHRMHARQPPRRFGIDAANAGMGMRAAYEGRLQQAGDFEIVDKAAAAAEQRPVFDPQHPVSDRVGISHAVNHLGV